MRLSSEQVTAAGKSLSDSAKETIEYFGAGITFDLELKVPRMGDEGSYSDYWDIEVIEKLGKDFTEIAEKFKQAKQGAAK